MEHKMKRISLLFLGIPLMFFGCSTEEASELERTNAKFLNNLGGEISPMQWWKTSVRLKVNVTTDAPVKLMLHSSNANDTRLFDYKEIKSTGTVYMTAPQGQGISLYLRCLYKGRTITETITLSGKLEETISLDMASTRSIAPTRASNPPASLCGASIAGGARYYEFTDQQLDSYFAWRATNVEKLDAKSVEGQICNYELESNGPFYITWVTGNEAEQRSHILGYYVHSAYTYDDIRYVDLSETHKWDYIDGLSKVQYQISKEETIAEAGQTFYPGTWYDANFDMSDVFGATTCYNPDRVGDYAYNMFAVYTHYGRNISALRGISFKIDVKEGDRVGFYLRAEAEPYPEQWALLREEGIRPYTSSQSLYKGCCFSAELMNTDGNGLGKHRSFIKDYGQVYWMGMEDLLAGGDHDCNDVIFGVVSDLNIYMPTIVDPALREKDPDDPVDPVDPLTGEDPFPWTIAYEDVGRSPDFDFNDAVIKLLPDYDNELCCVTVMAAGSNSRMYLHYDGPDGDVNMGEIHDLMGKSSDTFVNTKGPLASTPFTEVDCVPWPKGYTMSNDAQRFYIEIQRGTCEDCTDIITLAQEPGRMPEALLVAGEWQWPMEGTHIFDAYEDFPQWSKDVTRTRFWEWYKTPDYSSSVVY